MLTDTGGDKDHDEGRGRFRGRHLHLVGIAGAGVSALVPLLEQAGATVSGCDVMNPPSLEQLRRRGLVVHQGHGAHHLQDVDIVVHTAAVAEDHEELAAARAQGIRVMTRGECLVRLMTGRRTVAIAGSHGKTSTTWMLGHLLAAAGQDPVVMVGGAVASLGGGARPGLGDLFIAETDESDGSFAAVRPLYAVVTNLDNEHLDHYGTLADLEASFRQWLERIPAEGAAILPVAGTAAQLGDGLRCRVISCGLEQGDYHCAGLELGPDGSTARLIASGIDIGAISVPLPGAHMVLNAVMAIAVARLIQPDCPLAALAHCERVRRRFTVHGLVNGVRVVEDYGHHPTEVRATIAAARLGKGRVHVIFQPHRYSRTRACFADFTSAFDQAHAVAILPIYAASEAPIAGVDAHLLAEAINHRRQGFEPLVRYAPAGDEAIRFIATHARPGDTCLVLGAGDVGDLAEPLLRFLADAGHEDHVPHHPMTVATVYPEPNLVS